MPDNKPTAPPLDLSVFDNLEPAPAHLPALRAEAQPLTTTDPRLTLEPAPERLVEIANLSAADLAAAQTSAAKVDFRNTTTLLAHGDGALAAIAQTSRQLLTGVRLEDAGEVGRIAASVIDGVNILRIQDLQAEARGDRPVARKGLIGRLLGVAADAHTAFKGFMENRKQFLDLMDSEQAKARKTKADLTVSVQLLDQQAMAIRQSLNDLKIEIAGGQLALDRGQTDLEALRQNAVGTGDAADAADVMEFRSAVANFRGKIAEMRENLVASAMLIPIIGQNKKAAETRIMKISNGMLVVIPRLMAVASQAVVQVDIARAAQESEKLDEAARQITILASKGAHDAATSAARSLGGDQRNIDVLAQVADEAIKTMHEVIEIEREVASGDREREAKLTAIRDRLVQGMQGVNAAAVQR
ncbi:toxic anion resistance protein [Bradyrhizobium sp. LTSP885]|uniref:toxic anion resistance protein n=1 Tax=Bradyrhizobium sp. LTSP885 TaxID=1619232 RepID=UPI000B040E84|nr:toxic anion resistance protein [Bradyrhizobium sp. LTSP885]